MLVQHKLLLSDATSLASKHHAQHLGSSSALRPRPPRPCSFVNDIWSIWRSVNSIGKRREEETAWVPGWEEVSQSCAGQAWTCHWCKPKHHWCSLIGTSGGTPWWGLHRPVRREKNGSVKLAKEQEGCSVGGECWLCNQAFLSWTQILGEPRVLLIVN